ncbi:MAG: DUF2142 domain-containing protein [Bacteroidota bacterium]
MSLVVRYFVLLSLFFGSVYVLLVPPFQAPDEAHHFYRIYHISEGYWMGEKTDDQRFGGELPKSLHELAMTFRYLRYNEAGKVNDEIWAKAKSIELQREETTFLDFPNVAYYVPMPYLPQAAAVWIGKQFELQPLYLLYLTRFANLFIWIALITFALRILPFHQWTIAALALLPASLVFHSGINADAVTNGACFLLIASLLSLIFSDEQLRWKHFGLLLISATITLAKVVYAPIILLAWLIPIRKWKSKATYFAVNVGVLLFHTFLLLWWSNIAGDLFIPYDEYNPEYRVDKQLNPGVDPMAQLSFILEEPSAFLTILFGSYAEIFPYTLLHYFGKFGWEGNYMPTWSIVLLGLTTAGVAILEKPVPKSLQLRQKIAFLVIGLGMMLAFSIVIYMQWNAPRDPQITALSGRYFIPIFPFFFLALVNGKWQVDFNWKVILIIILVATQLLMSQSIYLRYYAQ